MCKQFKWFTEEYSTSMYVYTYLRLLNDVHKDNNNLCSIHW